MPPRKTASPLERTMDPTRRLSLSDANFLQQLLLIGQPPGASATMNTNTATASVMPSPRPSSGSQPAVGEPQPDTVRLLTTLTSRALHLDDEYWHSLRHQVEVDHTVDVLRYCAAEGYTPLKTRHLLQWLRKFQTIVEKRSAEEAVDHSKALAETLAGAEANTAAAAVPPASAASSGSGRRSGSNSKKGGGGRRGTQTKKKGSEAALEEAAAPTPPATPPIDVPAAEVVPALTYEELLQQHVDIFVRNEVELGWRWEQVPRQPSNISERSMSGPTNSKKKGSSRSERLRQQQQQQQEQEEEQRRLAAAAAMPPVNIYLSATEIPHFVGKFVYRGYLQHAALYEYLAANEQATAAVTEAVRLAVEVPAVVPPLQSAATTTILSGQAGLAPESGGGPAAHSKASSRSASQNRAGRGGKGSSAPPAAAPEPARPPTPPPSAMDQLRLEQQKEMKMLTREHLAAVAAEEHRRHVERTQKDMELLFEKEGTQKAVVDVYDSLELTTQERQRRILQRLEALEIAMGIKPRPVVVEPERMTPTPPAKGTKGKSRK